MALVPEPRSPPKRSREADAQALTALDRLVRALLPGGGGRRAGRAVPRHHRGLPPVGRRGRNAGDLRARLAAGRPRLPPGHRRHPRRGLGAAPTTARDGTIAPPGGQADLLKPLPPAALRLDPAGRRPDRPPGPAPARPDHRPAPRAPRPAVRRRDPGAPGPGPGPRRRGAELPPPAHAVDRPAGLLRADQRPGGHGAGDAGRHRQALRAAGARGPGRAALRDRLPPGGRPGPAAHHRPVAGRPRRAADRPAVPAQAGDRRPRLRDRVRDHLRPTRSSRSPAARCGSTPTSPPRWRTAWRPWSTGWSTAWGPSGSGGPAPAESHVPELAVDRAPALGAPPSEAAPWDRETPRPVRLFRRPEPLEDVTALLPDDPPLQFRWRGRLHRVRRAEGPERIGRGMVEARRRGRLASPTSATTTGWRTPRASASGCSAPASTAHPKPRRNGGCTACSDRSLS